MIMTKMQVAIIMKAGGNTSLLRLELSTAMPKEKEIVLRRRTCWIKELGSRKSDSGRNVYKIGKLRGTNQAKAPRGTTRNQVGSRL